MKHSIAIARRMGELRGCYQELAATINVGEVTGEHTAENAIFRAEVLKRSAQALIGALKTQRRKETRSATMEIKENGI